MLAQIGQKKCMLLVR